MSEIISTVQLVAGEKNLFKINVPVKYVIKTASGTVISGIITPNHPLEILPMSDIVSFNVYVDKDSTREIEIIKS